MTTAQHRTQENTSLTSTSTPSASERIQARDGVAVVVFTKPECRQCDMTKGVLDRDGVHYTTVDVTEDADALAYIKALGYMAAPVVYASTEDGDHHWAGFQPAKIREHITHRADADAA